MHLIKHVLTSFTLGLMLTACGGQKATSRGGFSEGQYRTLKGLNERLATSQQAINSFAAGTAIAGGRDRVNELAGHLRRAQCTLLTNEPRQTSFDVSWSATQVFDKGAAQGRCPLFSQRRWTFNRLTRDLTFSLEVRVSEDLFAGLSGIRTLHGVGTLRVRKVDATTTIEGLFTYGQLELTDVGALEANIRVQQQYTGRNGVGQVTITLAKAGEFTYDGGVRWQGSNFSDRTYFAGGGDILAENFQELFSYFELDKIVDDSERMR